MALKILSVFGTRPEAIKMAPLVQALNAAPDIAHRVCITGQHREMLDQVLGLFHITPDYDLNLMRPGQTLQEITAGILSGMEPVLRDAAPQLMLVHGDTTTTFAASLAAYYHKIPVAHVEAGLRTGNLYSPWPEEMNRKFAGLVARLHFAPTEIARNNLLAENIPDAHIHVTGNTVVDALMEAVRLLDTDTYRAEVRQWDTQWQLDAGLRTVLVTGHRRESFGDGFARICEALAQLAMREDVQVIYPVHLNENVQNPVRARLGGLPRVKLVAPQEYLAFVHLMRRADIILTDSGGVQEEAPSLGKPVLVMRETTERPEAAAAGTVKLVGTDIARITSQVYHLLDSPAAYQEMARAHNPYGDGYAAPRILAHLRDYATNTTSSGRSHAYQSL
jgi:UDP-N-acetylglucosamine 2-epimerase (non-hydrolysing)